MAEKLTRPQTVAEFQTMLYHVYGEANKRYSDLELVLRLMEEMGALGEVARKDERTMRAFELVSTQVARTCSWWFAITSRFGWDVQELLWNKYPGICPYCLHGDFCICGPEHPEIPKDEKEEVLRRSRRERSKEPRSFADHQALHNTLYVWQNKQRGPTKVVLHMLEEMAEVSKECRHKDYEKMQDEMADVASWMFAIMNLYGLDLAEAVWQLYPYECERCHKTVCDCTHEG